MEIITTCICPPIPIRNFDWQAYVEGTIDVCSDPECSCRNKAVVGHGATEQEAIDDLMEQIREKSLP